jgi:hypothetical protein
MEGLRLAYYTDASTAIEILKNECVWMRNTTLMNDYGEIKHGERAVSEFFSMHNPRAKQFWDVLNRLFPDIFYELDHYYSSWSDDLNWNTFVTSVSIHTPEEDELGRLSMWRAYGRNTGVALVFKPDIFFSEEDNLQAYSYPALYWNKGRIISEFERIIDNVTSNIDILASSTGEEVKSLLIHLFHSFAISLKHPGFEEEKEWRIIFRPTKSPKSPLEKSVETISGVPQIIYKIPLKEKFKTAPSQLLDRIIIGPSEHSWEVRDAFATLLIDLGLSDLAKKIVVSGIPLRN